MKAADGKIAEDRSAILARDSAAELYPRLVACAIIVRDGKVLLEKRGPAGVPGLDGSWDLPGGKVECGESVLDAVVREIQEELGITVRCTRLMPEPLRSVWKYGEVERHWLLVGCVCSIESGEPQVSDNLQWHPVDNLPTSLLDADRQFITHLAALSAAEGRERVLREKANTFVAKLDELTPAINNAFVFQHVHGMDYTGPTYERELAELRAALAAPAPGPPAKRYRLNSGPCAAMVVDCDCRICRPELEDRPAPCQCALCLAPRAPQQPSEQNELGSPQEIPREAIDLRTKYEALKLERDTERGLRESSEQENDRLRTERDGLKQRLADSDLAFSHANEVVGKLEADIARLSAPVTDEEINAFPWGFVDVVKARFDLIMAARTAPAKETPKCSG